MPYRLPEAGDVVEYPLSEHVQRELMDGRTHGVGLLVGRNYLLAQQNALLPLHKLLGCLSDCFMYRAPKGLGSLWSEFHCLTLCFWRPCFSLPQAFVLRTCAYCVPGGTQHRQRGRQEAAPQRTAHVRGGATAAGGGGV